MFDDFKDALIVDKALFPSRWKRIIICYVLPSSSLLIIALLWWLYATQKIIAVTMITLVLGSLVYLYLLPILVWMNKATKYIRENQRKTEG